MAFKAFKVHVPTSEISEQVQLAAFAKGYGWYLGRQVRHQHHPYLFFNESGIISYADSYSTEYFNNVPVPEVQVGG